MSSSGPLACPRCATSHPLSERFCPQCGMPLVHAGRGSEQPITATHERARKVRPEYARGEPVKVGFVRSQPEGEMVQGMLLEEGIPSMLRRNLGFDVPEALAGGARDVLVPETGAEAARRLLAGTELQSEAEELEELRGEAGLSSAGAGTSATRLALWVLAGAAAAAVIVWLLYQATG